MSKIEEIALKIATEKRVEKEQKIDRKQRTHKLIILGTLFTLLEIDDEDHDLLLGILINYYDLTDKQKKLVKEKGKLFKEEREKYIKEERMKHEG
ncbi:conjugal transfer protein TraD [Streptobacillus moniliformis]|uniref:conjugal transfer protein TraD n=1 Tax=Streptobacillus moniliformis TaxID=34105 RepID=UPI0007E3E2D3|nr:conjugal transfer protein TraD [Streptobacillus moniliformis]